VLGRIANEVFPFLAENGTVELMREALRGKRVSSGETPFEVSATRRRGAYEAFYSPLRDGEEAIIGVASIVRNVTQRSELEARLRQSVRDREDFVSVASHELRTPLTALQLTVEKLLRATRATLGDDRHPFVRDATRAVEQVHRLDDLVQELLDVSRLTSERFELQIQDVDLGAVVEASIERMGDALRRAGSAVRFTRVPVVGRWDRSRLERVVTNLLSNAVKYGGGKPIWVEVRADGVFATLAVRDEGIGIAAGDHDRVFERFERAVSSRNYGGFGLGLWIVREIVRKHGGSVHVTSMPGSGATFTVSLPRAAVPALDSSK
jgi:signal transduction histidine kinase